MLSSYQGIKKTCQVFAMKKLILMTKPINHLWLIFSLLFVLSLSGCGVSRQVEQASNLASCEFRILGVENVNLSGVEFNNIKSVNDLNFLDAARIMGGLASPVCPLSMQVDLEGRNPNALDAGLNRLEWILFIDDIRMTAGIIEKPFTIPAHGTLAMPVEIAVDLKQVLSGESAGAMLNFCMNLAGSGKTPTRFKIKLKPTVIIAGTAVTYPGYINVKTEYGAK
jgi:hypothetical protein